MEKPNNLQDFIIPDYNPQTPQDFIYSINIHEIQNNFRDLSIIQANQSFYQEDDLEMSFQNDIEYIKKEEEEYRKKKEEEYNNNKEDYTNNSQSQICDDSFYIHPEQEFPEKKEFEGSEIYPDKECPTIRERVNEMLEQLSELCQDFSFIDNMNQDNNQKIFLKQTKILSGPNFPEENEKEKKDKIYSFEGDKRKNKIDIPTNAINSKLPLKHSSNCPIHNGHEVKIDIQQKSDNSSQININPNTSLIQNNSEIKIHIPEELNDSNKKQIEKNSTINGSTRDSSQKNNPNTSFIDKYKYPFKIIHPNEEDLISKNMNISSENLFSNFKRKRESITKEVKKNQESFKFKKSEDLEKPILRKFKGYLRYKKDNGIKEFKDILDKDRNFWDSFLKNSKPFEFSIEGGGTKIFNSYGKDLMDFIFKRDDVDYLYNKFASDVSYIKHILKKLNKSKDYNRAYLITIKGLNKKYNGKYIDEDLDLGLEEYNKFIL